jgi:hypothetical protein
MVVVLIHTSECAFYAAGEECPGAISSLISIASLSDGLSLSGLCVSELCVSPVLVFSFGMELVPDLVLGEVRVKVRDLLVAWLPKILISCSLDLVFFFYSPFVPTNKRCRQRIIAFV